MEIFQEVKKEINGEARTKKKYDITGGLIRKPFLRVKETLQFIDSSNRVGISVGDADISINGPWVRQKNSHCCALLCC